MKYSRIILGVFLISVLFFACKKKNKETEAEIPVTTTGTVSQPVIYKVKTEEIAIPGLTITYEYKYDSQGRVVRINRSTGIYETFEWSPGKCIKTEFSTSYPDPREIVEFTLDSLGLCFSAARDSVFTYYKYDADGYKTWEIISGPNFESSYEILNGNVITTNSDVGNSTTEYFLDKNNTIGNLNKGMSFLGKQNKNLRKTITHIVSGPDWLTNFVYEFDSKNRVVKVIERVPQDSTIYKYTYYE
ncbi:MAG: hypothetical protein JNL60_16145 [Bacteroidia bacterium]|nr:hypothetical protein [Bacteroidia bacterium]